MKKNKIIKSIIVSSMFVVSAGVLTGCSNSQTSSSQAQSNLPSAKEIIKKNSKYKDYKSMSFDVIAKQGDNKNNAYVQYTKDSGDFHEEAKSDEVGSIKIWKVDKDIYVKVKGIVLKQSAKDLPSINDSSKSMDSILKRIPDLAADSKETDCKVKSVGSNYELSFSKKSPKVDTADELDQFLYVPNAFSSITTISNNAKIKNFSIKFLIGKKNYDTKRIVLAYDLKDKKTTNVSIDFKFNNIKQINVPASIKDDAIDGKGLDNKKI
ncbi:DUF6612 family protein [Lactobacillus agrestimuris]|uniref:DUF6612 family protein n=1 Tax=Lactobacillus agrestimuris TaxID=2941328 RepID=UPI00204302C0|nr:DUF6612 family protein [Lactobacillus agrestimuris]